MDEDLGPVMYHDESKGDYHMFKPYSEKLAEQIDEKVKNLVKERYAVSLKILTENKALIEKMKEYLLFVEYINKEEFASVMEDHSKIDIMLSEMQAKSDAKEKAILKQAKKKEKTEKK